MSEISALAASGVVIVDEDQQVRDVLRSGFSSRNAMVYEAGSVTEAIAHLQVGEVDLVISEMHVGGASGLDLLQHCRNLEPRPRFEFLTAETDYRVRAQAFSAGADDYIIKPAPLDEIIMKAERAILLQHLSRPPADFSGRMPIFSPEELVQLLEANKKTGELEFSCPYGAARVWFSEGKILHADFIGIEGSEAIYLLFAVREGDFEFRSDVQSPAQTINSSASMLLLEGMRMMDETKALLQARRAKGPPQSPGGTVAVGGPGPG
jgi:CheY-like chemotaxis protein